MSNLLFNYDELVRGGDSSFAVDYMVERILEEDAIYAEPTQEVIEKVDDLAYESPEDADEYIWEWLDGLAEEKGTWVYTLMFDQIWVSDGSSYYLNDYDFDEEDEEAIKFAGTPLEEKQTLSETYIKREFFEDLIDKFANEGYSYYPYDRNTDPTKISIFLSLEQEAGDNVKAFTFVPQRKGSGDVTGIGIFAMPAERYYFFDDATEEDLELLAGAGQLNESIQGWDKGIDLTSPEDLSDALVKAEASFIDPDFFYEEISIDVDRGSIDGEPYEDDYYYDLGQALFDAYGDDKLYYTYFFDDIYENDILIFSDGGYIIIEDSFNWTEDDFEMVSGAGMLEESYAKHGGWTDGIDWGTETDYIQVADRLADIGAKYIDMPKWLDDLYNDLDFDHDFQDYEELAYKFTEEFGSKDVLYYSDVEGHDGDPIFIFSDGTYWKANDIDSEGFELVVGAGMLNENKTPLQHLKSLSTRSGYELADTLANIGAHYVELPDSDIAYLEDLDYEVRDEELYKILDKILSKSDHEVIFTYFPYDETFNIATATFNEVFYLQDFDDVFGREAIELIKGAGQLNEVISEAWDDGIQWGLDNDVEEAADRLVEIGAKFIYFDFDPGELNQRNAHSYFLDVSELMQEEYGNKPDLYYSFEDFNDGNELHKAFVFSDGDYVDADFWSDVDIELFRGAGELFEESSIIIKEDDLPDYHYAQDLANWVINNNAMYYVLTVDDEDRAHDAWKENESFGDEIDEVFNILYDNKEFNKPIFTFYIPNDSFFVIDANSKERMYALDDFNDFESEEAKELIISASELDEGQLNESLADKPTSYKIEVLANDVVDQGLQYLEMTKDNIDELRDIADKIRDEEIPIGDYDKYIIKLLKEARQKTGKEHFTVVPVASQIQYAEDSVIDFQYYDEFLTRFLDNADLEDIELLRNAGQLNEIESSSWWRKVDWTSNFKAESLSDALASIGAEYIPEENLDLPDKKKYENDINGYANDSAYELKIHAKANNAQNLLFSIIEVGSDVFFISSDGFDYDLWDFSADDIELIIGAGQLKEYDTNWDEDLDFNTETSAEKVADRLVEIGAKYVEVTADIEPEEEYHETFRDYLDEMAKLFSEKYGHEEELYFTYYVDDDAFIFSDGTYWYDEAGFLSDDVDLIIGAGQLNEQNTSKWHKGIDWDRMSPEDIADALVKADAVYVHPDKFEQDSHKAEKFNPKYHLKNFGLIEPIVDLFGELYSSDTLHYTIFNDPLRQYTDKFITNRGEFWNVAPDGDDWTEEDYDMVIGAGMLNENQKLKEDEYPDHKSAEDVANFLANNGAAFYNLTQEEEDEMADAWDSGYNKLSQTTNNILNKHKEPERPIFTYHEGVGGLFYVLYNDGYGTAYFLEDFEDVDEQDAYDMIVNAGNLYEEEKKYVDPLASMTDSSSGLELADALAEAGARYIDAEWLDKIEYARWNDKAPRNPEDYIGDVIDELKNEFKKDDTIIFTYFQPDHVFITWDGKYFDTFYMEDFTDLSGTADVRMIIDAGMLNEAIDLEDNSIGDMIDAYTYDIYSLIDPMGANQGNVQDLSNGYMYKYGDSQNPADYYMENSWNTDLPKPIAETFEGLIESSFIKERALDYARDEFLGKHPEVEQEFYGLHDELDPDMLRDAGYDELADELKNDIRDQEAAFLEDDYEIRFGSAINTNFDRDPESIYVHTYCQIYEFTDGIILKEVDLGVAYNNIKTVEDFRNAMKDFMTEKISAFLNGEPPAEIHSDEEVDESKKPLNENANFENLLDNITKFPLHYVDLEDSLEKDMISYIQTSGMLNRRDDYEIDEYIWKTVSDYLEKLDRKAGFIDSEGRPETDEGFFTMLGSDFWGELGYFVNDDQWNVYTSMGFDDTYTLTKDEVQDVIEAGQIYDNPLKEQEEEETEYNPTFEQIDENIENATQELIYQVGRHFDTYGDPGIEELESGDGAIRFADGGFRSSDMQNITIIYGNMTMPTKEAEEKIEKLYDELYAEYHESAVQRLKDTSPEVYAEFAGDPEILTYRELEDAGDAYADVEPERSKMYYDAAQELDEKIHDYFYDDDAAMIYFDVEIQYKKADYPDGDYVEPELTFRGELGTNYNILAAKEVTKTFTSEEELEDALSEGTKDIEEWFDGSEYDKEVSEISEEVSFEDSKRVYGDLVRHARNTIDLANPLESYDADKESYLSYDISENVYIDMMEYMNGNFELPPDFEKSVIFDVDDRMYESAESAVMNDIEDYIPKERFAEFAGIQDDLVELYKSGDLEDIDEDLYSEIKQAVDDKYGGYQDNTGVMRGFELFVDSEEEKIQLIAKIDIDPEYENIKEKKDVELSFSEVDKAKEIIQNMANWLNGDAYL